MSVESDNPKRDRPKEGRVPDETQVPKQDESEGESPGRGKTRTTRSKLLVPPLTI